MTKIYINKNCISIRVQGRLTIFLLLLLLLAIHTVTDDFSLLGLIVLPVVDANKTTTDGCCDGLYIWKFHCFHSVQ